MLVDEKQEMREILADLAIVTNRLERHLEKDSYQATLDVLQLNEICGELREYGFDVSFWLSTSLRPSLPFSDCENHDEWWCE